MIRTSKWPLRWLTRAESLPLRRALMAHHITWLEFQQRCRQLEAQSVFPNEEREA